MQKRTIFGVLMGLVLALGLGAGWRLTQTRAAGAGPARPNVVFIISDDHTAQAISAYGSRLTQTPGIDRLAREGAILYNNVVSNSICGPSRATLLTGKLSHVNGFRRNEERFNINQAVFPEELQKNGYQTAWIGKMHLGSLPHGFDYLDVLPAQGHYYNPDFIDARGDTTRRPGYVTSLITQLATGWLSRRDPARPFLLIVGHKGTHREWLPDLPDLGAYDAVTFPLPPAFYDDYAGRVAAQNQDMTIAKTLSLPIDLKVHADYDRPGESNPYNRLDAAQKAAFRAYYDGKVSREFDEKSSAAGP